MSSRQSPQPSDATHERFLEIILALRARLPPDDLARLDRLLLEELGGGATFWELTEAAWRLPNGGHEIAAPRANQLCPMLWRWLHDAWRRGLVRPDDMPPETITCWRLTRRGAIVTARSRRDAWAWVHAFVFGHWRPSSPLSSRAAALGGLRAVLARQDVDLEGALQAVAARLPQPVAGFEAPAHWSPRPLPLSSRSEILRALILREAP